MKLTRNLLAILAITSFTLAFAGDAGKEAKHHEVAAGGAMEKTMGGGMQCTSCADCASPTADKTPAKAAEKSAYYTLEGIYHP